MNRIEWFDRMLAEIRFVPDRGAIREELLAHMNDKRDHLLSRGYTPEEVSAMELEAMGDPEEVGRRMNAVHKPWLGWLWKISGWLLILAVVVLIWCVLRYGWFYEWDRDRLDRTRLDPAVDTIRMVDGQGYHRLFYREGGDSFQWKRYTISVERTALWDDNTTLFGHLKADGFLPWEGSFQLEEAYAVDDLGNRYWSVRRADGLGEDLKGLTLDWGSYRTLTAWWYNFYIQGLDPRAQWVELRYDRGGQNMTLRIDLTGGEGQ